MKMHYVTGEFTHLAKNGRRRRRESLVVLANDKQDAVHRANLWLCERYRGIVWNGELVASDVNDFVFQL